MARCMAYNTRNRSYSRWSNYPPNASSRSLTADDKKLCSKEPSLTAISMPSNPAYSASIAKRSYSATTTPVSDAGKRNVHQFDLGFINDDILVDDSAKGSQEDRPG
uniref:Uncharacterized protein n=1 Tax=Lygus hesperus TaxID=30085 RepID=A0A146L5K4_LYGHE